MVKRYLIVIGILAAVILLGMHSSSRAQGLFAADSKVAVTSTIVANNTTAIVISANPSTVYQVDAFNNATTLAYIKLYNAASGVTCGQTSPAPIWRAMIPFGTSSSGGGFTLPNINGDAFANGVTMCVTTGIADSDTGSPAATTYIVNVHWKRQQ